MLTSILASVYTVLRMIPTFPVLGFPGATFPVSDIVTPVYGMIFGAIVGPASIVLGSFLSIFLGRPIIFLGLDFLPATVNALVVVLMVRGKWTLAVAVYVGLLITFILNPFSIFTVEVPLMNLRVPFLWFHFATLAVLLSPLCWKAADWITGSSLKRLAPNVFALCLVGTMSQHLTGSLLFETVYGMILRTFDPATFTLIWSTVFWLYPVERMVIALIATVIGVELVRTFKAARLLVAES